MPHPTPRRLARFLPAVVRLEDRTTPAIITVTSLADTVAVDGVVTLREAIRSINAGASVNSDLSLSGGTYGSQDAIYFNSPLTGTITLTSDLDPLTRRVTIQGGTSPVVLGSPLVTIDGADQFTTFTVTAPTVTLFGLAIVRSSGDGIRITGPAATGTRVRVCYVGIDPDGTTARPNAGSGVRIDGGASGAEIGGGFVMVISGNLGAGVTVTGLGTANTDIRGAIGTSRGGTLAVGNAEGVVIADGATNTRVNGAISGNRGTGVRVDGANTSGTQIIQNSIGTALGNGGYGVVVRGAMNTTIGNGDLNQRNVISANALGGVLLDQAVGVTIRGNFIGTNSTGTAALGNGGSGVDVAGGSTGVVIGGTTFGAGNLISGNRGGGVRISAAGVVVQGNEIGTDAAGTAGLPNAVGVEVVGGTDTLVGGVGAGEGNVVAFNTGTGVLVRPATAAATPPARVQVLGNSIFSNGGLGIDLSATTTADGVTPNDPNDADTGANGLQNFPAVEVVVGNWFAGTYVGKPGVPALLQFFASPTADPSGFGEGQTFVISFGVTPVGGMVQFAFTAPFDLAGRFLSGTATTGEGTSEFGPAVRDVTAPPTPTPPPPLPPNTGLVPGKSALVVGAGTNGGGEVVVFNADGTARGRLTPFPGFAGGVRVGTADVNGDGFPDILTAAGPGGGPHVRVFSGVDGAELLSFFAYDPSFTGGVWVAGGDVTGDGYADIVTGAGAGGGPHVKVFDGRTGAEVAGFFAYAPAFRGGVTVAVGDVNGDGRAEVITGAGSGGSPHVKVIGATALTQSAADGQIADSALLASYYAFDATFTGGVNVSAGADFNGDRLADVVAGAGAGGGPQVKVLNSARVNDPREANGQVADSALLATFFAYEPAFTGGVRVGTADVNGDGFPDILTAAGPGGGPRVRALRADGVAVADFFAFAPEYAGGVFVG